MSRSLHTFNVGHHSSSSKPRSHAVNRAGNCPAMSPITSVWPSGVSGSTNSTTISSSLADCAFTARGVNRRLTRRR
jgi:hypothetical protein